MKGGVSTVLMLRKDNSAISGVDKPLATKVTISFSLDFLRLKPPPF